MAFQFHQSHDIQSLQKVYQEKESKRLKRNVEKAQESSRNLQERLSLSRGTSQPPQICDAPVISEAHNVDGTTPSEGCGPFTMGTAPNIGGSRDLSIPTAPNGLGGHGTVLDSAPLSWGVGAANGCLDVDPWPHTFSYQPNANDNDIRGWSVWNASTTYQRLGDANDGLGLARPPSTSSGWVADGLDGRSAPMQQPDNSGKDATDSETHILTSEAGSVEPKQPLGHAMTSSSTLPTDNADSCASTRAPSEACSTVMEASRDTSLPKTSVVEVLIGACPPQDAPRSASIPDYPTPSSDHSQTSQEPAKEAFGGRKRARNTTCRNVEALQGAGADDNEGIPSGLRRSKRRRNGSDTNHQNNSGTCERLSNPPADMNGLSAPVTQHSPLTSRKNQVRSASVSRLRQASMRPRARNSPSGWSQPHGPIPGRPKSNAPSAESLLAGTHDQACANCGVDRARLLRLSQNILRWAGPPDSASLEAALMNGPSLSARDREAIILRLALGALRDYILAPLGGDAGDPADQQSHCPRPLQAPKAAESDCSRTVQPPPSSPSSDLGDSSDTTSDTIEDEDNGLQNGGICSKNIQGQKGRWSELEERRLGVYVEEGLSWPQIAKKLNRSESGVQQHWRIMSQK